jgi:hypothetical protein
LSAGEKQSHSVASDLFVFGAQEFVRAFSGELGDEKVFEPDIAAFGVGGSRL